MKAKATRIRRSPYLGVAALASSLGIVTAVLLCIFSPHTAPDLALLTASFGWPFALVLVAAWGAYASPRRKDLTLAVVDGALLLDGVTLRGAGVLTSGEAT